MNNVRFEGKDICPSKIVCIGRNYVGHIKELGNSIPEQAVIFIKPNSAISKNLDSVRKDLIHYEGEISFLIEEGEISGVGFGLDLTKREIQTKLKSQGFPWERSKAFDKSAVFGDFVSFSGNNDKLRMELHINSKLIQEGSSELMLNKPAELLKEIKSFLTLENGDIIMTGTPKGVGAVCSGDSFTGKIFEDNKLLIENSWVAI